MSKKIVISIVVILVILGFAVFNKDEKPVGDNIKIGVITDLTGPASYWGESTLVGAQLAQKELQADGYNVELVIEDHQFNPQKALSSAQKLVNVDDVNALYAEFNPAIYAISPFLKDKNIPLIYSAGITAPLKDSPYTYKTYLDFEIGCQALAQKYKEQGINKLGFLKLNWEAGELCLTGVKKVYEGDNLVVETFNFGDNDVKTQLLKLKSAGIEALINASLESDTITVFKAMKDLALNIPYGTVIDGIADNVKTNYPDQVKRSTVFDFQNVNSNFSTLLAKETSKKIQIEQAAALSYLHIKQIVMALDGCNDDLACVTKKMDESKANNIIGFNGFKNRIADFTMVLR